MIKRFTIEVKEEVVQRAAVVLGTTNLRDTILGALDEMVTVKRRGELVDLAVEPGRYDFDDLEENWSGWEIDPAEEAKKSLLSGGD